MKKMNNKGFAISTMLYGLLILIVLIIAMILSTMAFNRKNSREFSEQVVDELENIKDHAYANPNIQAAYKYDSSTCVTGEEDTCEKIPLIDSNTNIPAGTIIRYAVQDTEIVTFHVMYDNGTTLTMQSQKNIVNNTPWISNADYITENTDSTSCRYTSCNDEGPMTVLVALERATKSWTNVNDQTYTMGTTTFKTNAYTGCTSSSCTTNTYTLPSRTAKARMITLQETLNLGCTGTEKSCPNWMNNYLSNSTSYGGTVNDDSTDPTTGSKNDGYWFMNAPSTDPVNAFFMYYTGDVGLRMAGAYNSYFGARAVVVINK